MNYKIIGDRIKQARNAKGYTQEDIANHIGVNKSTILRYEHGDVKNIKIPILEAIAHFLSVNPAWLAGKSNNSTTERLPDILPLKTQKIPLLGEIACGKPIVANREYELYVDATSDIHADYAVKARGDSMINARIYDGDIVFIKEQPDVENGEIAAVVIEDEITLKRVYKDENSLELRAENPRIKPFVYRGEELNHIKILGKAIAFQGDII